MRRIFYLAVSIVSMLMFAACSSGDELLIRTVTPYKGNTPQVTTADLPATEVYAQGAELGYGDASTRATYYGGRWPKAYEEEGWDAARFSVLIDPNIKEGFENSSNYWGGFGPHPNLGGVWTGFNFSHYNDRNFNYYDVEVVATGDQQTGLYRYAYNPTGIEGFPILKEIPPVTDYLESYLKSETNATKRLTLQESINGLKDGSLKVIWYIAKEVATIHAWHVNGMLTKSTTNSVLDVTGKAANQIKSDVTKYKFEVTKKPVDLADAVEVDIHLQEHKDWNEIKTSTHIRSHSGAVIINLPLTESNIVEQDDFNIRVYDYYYKEYENVKTKITHDNKGITIEITGVEDDMIDELKANFGDGLTVEVNSYCKQIEGVWEELKKSSVVTEKACDVMGQITTAFSDDKVIIGN